MTDLQNLDNTTVTAPGALCWADLSSTDHAASIAFYSGLFGWSAQTPDPALGHYASFLRDGERIAGSMPGAVDAWTVYVATPDAERTATRVSAAGGSVHAPAMDVMDLGRMAVVGDVGDAAFGLWQPGTHRGFAVMDVPGAPSWFELHTRDYDAVLPFYAAALGWQVQVVSDQPGFRYSTASVEGREVAGLMDAVGVVPDDAPTAWIIYFACADVDADLARAVELGASVVHGPQDSPYGWLATLTDPQGVTFKLRQPVGAA